MTSAFKPLRGSRNVRVLTAATFSLLATTALSVAQDMPVYEGVDDLPVIQLRDTEPYAQDSSGGRATQAFADYVKEASKGKINIEIFWAGSLMGANENAEGIASGLADMGMVAPIYDPASFPIANWLTTMGNQASLDLPLGVEAFDAAHWEFALTNPELKQEFADRGLQVLGATATFAFDMLCTSPVKSLADAKGKRARAAGVVYSREAEAVGMVPVPLIPAEMYEAFQRGIVDCIILHPPGYNIFGMMSVDRKKYFVNAAFSGFNSQYFSINKAKWDAMPPVAQQIITDGYLRFKSLSLAGQYEDYAKFAAQIDAGEAEPVEVEQDFADALLAHQKKEIANMPASAPSTVTDPQGMIDTYIALIAKWRGILENEIGWAPKPTDVPTRLNAWKNPVDYAPFITRLREELLKDGV